jgi:O-acetyl-ADP-ribose deacetylase
MTENQMVSNNRKTVGIKRNIPSTFGILNVDGAPSFDREEEDDPDRYPVESSTIPEQVIDHISLAKGDITDQYVDAIVNAANPSLLGGGGVDGAIHRAAGPNLDEECMKLGGCAIGDAKITKGYQLPARFVIHTVGPIWKGGDQGEDASLASCYHKSLELATSRDLKTISFPAISTGVYGFPLERATKIAVTTVMDYLLTLNSDLKVIFVCRSNEAYQVYQAVLKGIASGNGKNPDTHTGH